MSKPAYKALFHRARFLNQLGRDLERISAQLDLSRVVRFFLRKVGDALGADLAFQVDLDRTGRMIALPYILPLTPKGRTLAVPAELRMVPELLSH